MVKSTLYRTETCDRIVAGFQVSSTPSDPLSKGLPESSIDKRHVTDYACGMIKTFADKETLELYETGKSKRLPPDIRKRAMRRLEYLDLATGLEDLKVPPSNRLHELQRERKGQYSISVNDQWRICFRFEDGDAYDVELTDYH